MRVFVTGGSGLLGSHLSAHLRARGDQVVALQRPGSDTSFLDRLGCAVVTGDVRESPSRLAEPMAGCDAIVHAAALVYRGKGWDQVHEVNVAGTEHVFRAAAAAGISRAIHLSSVVVYGRTRGEVDEDRPTDGALPAGDVYARSKREAERVARRVERDTSLMVTVLRVSGAYGERDRLMLPALARMARRRVVPLLGSGTNPLPVVYAGNVAVAMAAVLDAERPGSTYDVGLDRPLTQRRLMEQLARALGERPLLVATPPGLVRAAANVLDRFGVRPAGARHLALARLAHQAMEPNPYPSRRIREELGWDPPFDHESALERSARWLLGSETRSERSEHE